MIASKILICCFYLISLPMAWWLSIELEVGVTGLWRGFALGQIVIVLLYAFFIYHISWQDVFRLNRDRKEGEQIELLKTEKELEDLSQR